MSVFRRRTVDFVLFCSAEDTVSADCCNSAVRGCTVCFAETDGAERDYRTHRNMCVISAGFEDGSEAHVFSESFAWMNRTGDRRNTRRACCNSAVRVGICISA